MTDDEIHGLWQDADAALRANCLEDAERSATALVAALERAEPTLELPTPLSYGLALGVLANVRLNRSGAQAAVDVFENALKRIEQDPPGLRRGLVWINFARLLEYLRSADAAGAAVTAIREIDSQARALDAEALGVLFESVDMLQELQASSEIVLTSLRGVLEAAEGATPKATTVLVRAHQHLKRILFALGRYPEALPHAEFMVGVQIARFGDNSAEAADARVDYGLTLDQAGNYTEAELRYRRALPDLRRHRGEDDDSVTLVRQNLAELARIRGDLDEAERQFRTLEAEDRARHPDMRDRNSQLLINFGKTLLSLTRYDEAAEKLNGALEIRAAHNGTDSPRYARVLLALGQLARQRGRYDEAATTLEQTAKIYSNVGDAASADYALFEAGLAAIHLAEPTEAGRRAREMIAKAQTRLGEYHPEAVAMLSELVLNEAQALAKVGWKGPLRDQVRRDVEELDDLGRFLLVDMLSSLGERPLRAALDQRRQWQLLHLSLVMSAEERSQAAVDRAWRFVTRFRGAETTALRLRARRYIQYDPSGKRARIAQIKARLVEVDLDLARNKDDQRLRSDRGRLVDELADLEFLLAAGTSQRRLNYEFIGQEAPRLNLEGDSALLAVSNYLRLPDGAESYAVFVAKGDDPVRLVDLGAATPIDDAITRYRQAVAVEGRRASPNENAWRDPGLWLASHVLDVLRPYLDGVRQLRVLADGALALIPLSTLPKPGGGFVLDDFDITYDVSLPGMPGVMYEEDFGIDAPPFVIGAPKYTTGQSGQRDPEEETDFLAQFRSGARFDPLPHAEEECRAISQLLQVSPLLGSEATEAALTSLSSPEVLHVCTHGFYLSGRETEQIDGEGLGLGARSSLADSLDRTGLALTGANDYLDGCSSPPGVADGILYGAEIADCDFMRTDLVTLSACQTGLGDVARGDGVHGLQRAFLSAGAKTVVCSLWEVPDAPTRQMFTSFYTRVLAGEPRGNAFHQTVRELAARHPHHPVAWGGFILVGRTDPLARFTGRQLSIRSFQWPTSDDADEPFPARKAEKLIARAQQQADAGDVDGSLATLEAGLASEGVPSALIAQMMYTAAGVQRKAGRYDDAARAYAELEQRPDLPRRLRLSTVFDAGTNYLLMGDGLRAVERYSLFLTLKPSLDETAMALVNRAGAYFEMDDADHGLADLTVVIDGATMPPDQRAIALISRARYRLHQGDVASALADADRVLDRSGAAPDQVASAYVIKGLVAQSEGRSAEALNYFKSAREVPEVTPSMAQQLSQLEGV